MTDERNRSEELRVEDTHGFNSDDASPMRVDPGDLILAQKPRSEELFRVLVNKVAFGRKEGPPWQHDVTISGVTDGGPIESTEPLLATRHKRVIDWEAEE